jgi:hypothetical protein
MPPPPAALDFSARRAVRGEQGSLCRNMPPLRPHRHSQRGPQKLDPWSKTSPLEKTRARSSRYRHIQARFGRHESRREPDPRDARCGIYPRDVTVVTTTNAAKATRK